MFEQRFSVNYVFKVLHMSFHLLSFLLVVHRCISFAKQLTIYDIIRVTSLQEPLASDASKAVDVINVLTAS